MALQVWLPLNKEGDFQNRGLADITVTNNGATYNSSGKVGGCYNFDGVDDSILVPFNSFITDTYSICLWFYRDSWGSKGYETLFGGPSGFEIDSKNGSYATPVVYTTYSFGSGSISYSLNTWNHLVVVRNTEKTLWYLNGELKFTGTAGAIPTGNYYIGAWTNGVNQNFKGLINDVRIYDHCLSPKEVKEISKALVLHYPLNDAYVEGTTNERNCITGTAYNRVNDQYGYNNTSNIAKVDGVFQGRQCTKVYPVANGSSFLPYSYIPAFVSDGGSYPKTKTVSFDYYSPCATTIKPYRLGEGSATITYKVKNSSGTTTGSGTNSIVIPVIIKEWNHVEFTVTATTTASAEWGYIINGSSVTASDDTYYLYANVQVEEKDHATPFTPSTRTATTVYDCSGYSNNGTITGSLSCSDDSPRYKVSTVFDGSSYIKETDTLFKFQNNFSYNCWIKQEEITNTTQYIFTEGRADSSTYGYGIGVYGGSARMCFGGHSISTSYNAGAWIMLTGVVKDGVLYAYKNGVLINSVSITTFPEYTQDTGIGIGCFYYSGGAIYKFDGELSDFRIYATALSADDVKELYNTSVMVCNNGTMLAYELEE